MTPGEDVFRKCSRYLATVELLEVTRRCSNMRTTRARCIRSLACLPARDATRRAEALGTVLFVTLGLGDWARHIQQGVETFQHLASYRYVLEERSVGRMRDEVRDVGRLMNRADKAMSELFRMKKVGQ